ncbi:uncharacterized protein LOC141601241 [Silene latifolia]|uniref:uncharacterized protein LOC141601241 n=1 Tax=Silene latifolia TaxID=37657 RepID=UPI003D789104
MKEDVKLVPAWVRLHDLPLKFWGKCLPAIAGRVGRHIKFDHATIDKTRLGFARTLVELKVGMKFPNAVKFLDENGKLITIKVDPTKDLETKTVATKVSATEGVTSPIVTPVKVAQSPLVQQVTDEETVQTVVVSPQGTPAATIIGSGVQSQSPPDSGKIGNPSQSEAGLFGLLETKINGDNVSNISNNMLDGWSVTTNCRLHKGGRVWLLWQPSLFDVMVLQYDAQFIHAKVIARCTQQQFFLTMIYAFNEGSERVDLWNKLKNIAQQYTGPWSMAGDFNTVTSLDERLGGNTRQEDMDDFNQCIATCGVTDIHAT